jgi:hypothetical protein
VTTLAFRNVDVSPTTPVSAWPLEAIQTALERGGLGDWRRLAAPSAALLRTEVGVAAGISARLRSIGDRLCAGAVIAAQRELVEELAHRLAELLAGADPGRDACQSLAQALRGRGMRGKPLGISRQRRGHRDRCRAWLAVRDVKVCRPLYRWRVAQTKRTGNWTPDGKAERAALRRDYLELTPAQRMRQVFDLSRFMSRVSEAGNRRRGA